MDILLKVKDEKADSLLDVLKGLSFVKAKKLTPANVLFLTELKQAVENTKLAKNGKIKGKHLQELLNEL